MSNKVTFDDTVTPKCIHCDGTMRRVKLSPSNPLVIVCGVIVALIGLALVLVSPVVSVPVFCTGAFFILRKRSVWQCERCGYHYDVN
jgi:hypothetical protein